MFTLIQLYVLHFSCRFVYSYDLTLRFEKLKKMLFNFFRDRAVTAYFETENEHVDKVLPIMTQPFDFKERK